MDEIEAVRSLLAAADFYPPDDDVAALVEVYKRMRSASTLLFAVEEARYESPAEAFRADQPDVDW